jgi:hypothetical protein
MNPVILLHAGAPSPKLLQFLQSIEARLLNLAEYDTQTKLTHIITTGNQDFTALSQAYHTVEDDVRLIALTEVLEFSSFLSGNGRLVWDVSWEQGELGKTWLEKFFLGAASVHLDESFPTVKDGGHFKVMNIFKIGVELDRMAAFVHARGDSAVSARTFLDHALYYLTYLHQAGVAQLPIEVDYGHTGSETVVQLHLPVNGFVAEHMLDSFCAVDSKDAQRFVLGVCARSADFLEVQYIQSAAKLVISGFWRPQEGKRQRGLMLNHIQTTAQIRRTVERIINETSTPSVNDKPLVGSLAHVSIGEEALFPISARRAIGPEASKVIEGKASQPEESRRVSGGTPEAEESRRVSGGTPEAEENRKVAGSAAETESVEVVRGAREAADKLAQKISSDIVEEIEKQILKGERVKPDDFVMRITAGAGTESKKGGWNLRAGLSNTQAAETVKGHLAEFAVKIGKTPDTLANEDYQLFSAKVLPVAIREVSDVGIITSEEQEQLIQEAMKRTGRAPAPSVAVDTVQAMLTGRLQRAETENAKMKDLLDAAKTELRVLKDLQKQMQVVQAPIAVEALSPIEDTELLPLEVKMRYMQDLASGKASELDAKKMREALEREQKTLESARAAENEVRKARLEIKQKEVLFAQELEKTQRSMKSRDLIMEKAKESFQLIVAKKDKQIAELAEKVQGLNGLQATSQLAFQESKRLEQEKQSLTRMVEIYKNKLASVSANLEKQSASPTGKKDDEVRRAVMDRQRAESTLKLLEKEMAKLKSKAQHDQQELMRLRGEKKFIEEKLQTTAAQLTVKERAPAVQDLSGKVKELEREIQAQTTKAERLELTNSELEQKVAELTASLTRTGSGQVDQALKTKVTHMENTMKKLTTDLTAAATAMAESKKEVNKLRSEKTALQNQLDKLKKDSEKAAKKAA